VGLIHIHKLHNYRKYKKMQL